MQGINALKALRRKCTAAILLKSTSSETPIIDPKAAKILQQLQKRKQREQIKCTHAWNGWSAPVENDTNPAVTTLNSSSVLHEPDDDDKLHPSSSSSSSSISSSLLESSHLTSGDIQNVSKKTKEKEGNMSSKVTSKKKKDLTKDSAGSNYFSNNYSNTTDNSSRVFSSSSNISGGSGNNRVFSTSSSNFSGGGGASGNTGSISKGNKKIAKYHDSIAKLGRLAEQMEKDALKAGDSDSDHAAKITEAFETLTLLWKNKISIDQAFSSIEESHLSMLFKIAVAKSEHGSVSDLVGTIRVCIFI